MRVRVGVEHGEEIARPVGVRGRPQAGVRQRSDRPGPGGRAMIAARFDTGDRRSAGRRLDKDCGVLDICCLEGAVAFNA